MNEKALRYLSTFSGIGGFELGIQQAFHVGKKPKRRDKKNGVSSNGGSDSEQQTISVSCVGYSERDKYAVQIYQGHFPDHKNWGDITRIDAAELPDFDLLVGGFPCQAFSIAGRRGGFSDTRGTLFFDLARILKAKRPRLFLFENVKGLLSHDNGRTFATIVSTVDELGYDLQWEVLNSKDFGVPQNRERVFLVGHTRGTPRPKVFPLSANTKADIVLPTLTARYYGAQANGGYIGHEQTKIGTLRTHKDGNGFREIKAGISPTIPARAREDGSGQPIVVSVAFRGRENGSELEAREDGVAGTLRAANGGSSKAMLAYTLKARADSGIDEKHPQTLIHQRPRGKNNGGKHALAPTITGKGYQDNNLAGGVRRLTPTECERLQGFPDSWTAGVSDTQRYKTLGNAVTVNVIQAIVERIYESLELDA